MLIWKKKHFNSAPKCLPHDSSCNKNVNYLRTTHSHNLRKIKVWSCNPSTDPCQDNTSLPHFCRTPQRALSQLCCGISLRHVAERRSNRRPKTPPTLTMEDSVISGSGVCSHPWRAPVTSAMLYLTLFFVCFRGASAHVCWEHVQNIGRRCGGWLYCGLDLNTFDHIK